MGPGRDRTCDPWICSPDTLPTALRGLVYREFLKANMKKTITEEAVQSVIPSIIKIASKIIKV